MADYRDLAAALGGGYGQDTGGITPDTLATLRNGKTASASDLLGMLKAIGSGSLSNLESLVRGSVAQVPGAGGDLEGLGRMGINKAFGAGGVNVSPTPVLPTTTDILGMMPRVTTPRRETAGMEELGGYMAPTFGKVAKPALMATGRLAGEEINAAMTGQPTRSLLGDITPKPLQLDVYHGTPHTLPPTERNPLGEFDASKIGTGEGAQMYGYGIYTAEAPAVATKYKLAEATYKRMQGGLTNKQEFVSDMLSQGRPEMSILDLYAQKYGGSFDDAMKDLIDVKEIYKKSGNLYKVDLPDKKIATMLDWDKPVSQQKNVMNALRNEAEQRVKNNLLPNIENDIRSKLPVQDIGNDYLSMFGNQNVAINQDIRKQALEKLNKIDLQPLVEKELNTFKPLDMNWDMSGKDFYEILSTRSGSAQQASNILQQQGVAGIKYLDEVSRSRGQGTRNFVVFPGEEKSMTILERNAEKSAK